ncbi:hypothetical protein D3C81_134500 [compost metagenome]
MGRASAFGRSLEDFLWERKLSEFMLGCEVSCMASGLPAAAKPLSFVVGNASVSAPSETPLSAASGQPYIFLRQVAGAWYNWVLIILAAVILLFIIFKRIKVKR